MSLCCSFLLDPLLAFLAKFRNCGQQALVDRILVLHLLASGIIFFHMQFHCGSVLRLFSLQLDALPPSALSAFIPANPDVILRGIGRDFLAHLAVLGGCRRVPQDHPGAPSRNPQPSLLGVCTCELAPSFQPSLELRQSRPSGVDHGSQQVLDRSGSHPRSIRSFPQCFSQLNEVFHTLSCASPSVTCASAEYRWWSSSVAFSSCASMSASESVAWIAASIGSFRHNTPILDLFPVGLSLPPTAPFGIRTAATSYFLDVLTHLRATPGDSVFPGLAIPSYASTVATPILRFKARPALCLGGATRAASEVKSRSEHTNTGGYTCRVEMYVVGPCPLGHTKAHDRPSSSLKVEPTQFGNSTLSRLTSFRPSALRVLPTVPLHQVPRPQFHLFLAHCFHLLFCRRPVPHRASPVGCLQSSWVSIRSVCRFASVEILHTPGVRLVQAAEFGHLLFLQNFPCAVP